MFRKVVAYLPIKSVSSTIKHRLSTTQLHYELYNEQQFQPNTKLFDELVNVASSAYQHPYDTILNAVQESNRLYVLRDAAQTGPILGCFLIQYDKEVTLLDRHQKIPVIYHSFMIVNEKLKNTGLAIKLMEYFASEVYKRKGRQPLLPLILYYVTATPAIIYQTDKFIKMVPSVNNYDHTVFTDEEWYIANELRKLKNWPTVIKSTNVNPFVVKGIMKTRYSTSEQMRNDKIAKKINYKIFQDLGIDETNGDRLLRFGFVG
ncbi:unnamed protein product [Adineta steineri]|uniref:N-acetyltransferase domain-containing protein n=1 Tax=Adineta steineri TaxID=433720 RepID=A0A815JVY9_9BILA|nr:unnamed protein product [Adineta steineri]CAF3484164.1 unnamed protein product [Adineta steineri]